MRTNEWSAFTAFESKHFQIADKANKMIKIFFYKSIDSVYNNVKKKTFHSTPSTSLFRSNVWYINQHIFRPLKLHLCDNLSNFIWIIISQKKKRWKKKVFDLPMNFIAVYCVGCNNNQCGNGCQILETSGRAF